MPLTDRRRDLWWAAATGLTAFAVYLRTLAPGLVAVLDTPMFQFIGRVLGVAHNPGYPLYVLVTYPFSYLPIGSLAYRINLFSALCGAVTVALVFLIARELSCRRGVSAAAALGLAFGHIFWSQSVIAEVYTLDTAIIAGMTLSLLVWGRTGRTAWFYGAVGLFAAGLGNHTTIVGFLPGMAIYAWLTHRAFVTRPKTLALTALVLSAGVLQYSFILIRSAQPDAYVESPARSVAELVGVMRGQQFGDRLFVFGWQEVVTERIPWLVGQLIVPELTVPGVWLAAGGAAWLLWRRPSLAWLVGLGAFATAGFVVNYSVIDAPVFMIPATVMFWIAVAIGGEQVIRVAGRVRPAGLLATAAMFMLPAWLLATNFAVTDRSGDTTAGVTFDRLFETLPDRTAIVREDFLVDRMVMFKLIGDRSAGTRRIELVGRDAGGLQERVARGERVFAFGRSARRLRYEGVNVSYAPVALLGDRPAEFLSSLPQGSIVAIAVPAAHADAFWSQAGAGLGTIGAEADMPGRRAAAAVVVGVTGVRRGAMVIADGVESATSVRAGTAIGDTGRRVLDGFDVRAAGGEAAIRRGGREVVWSRDGAVMATWDPDGKFERAFAMQAGDDFRVPIAAGALSVHEIDGRWRDQAIGPDWVSIDERVGTGSLMLQVAGGTTMVIQAWAAHPLAPRVIDQSSPEVAVEARRLDRGDDSGPEWRPDVPPGFDQHAYRIEVRATGRHPVSVIVALGGVPAAAVSRSQAEGTAGVGRLFGVDTSGLLRVRDRSTQVLMMARDDQAQLIGAGWSAVDWDEVSPYRWITETDAHLVLPVRTPGVSAVHVQAYGAARGMPGTVRLIVDGADLGERAVGEGWQRYEWLIPGGIGPGTRHVVLSVDRLPPAEAGGVRGLAVSEIRLIR